MKSVGTSMGLRAPKIRIFLAAADVVLGICLAVLFVATARWPQISDDVLIHYVVFLLHHGMAPYRQIIDVNMPGTYLVDAGVSAVLGTSALAWRSFDWALMGVAVASMVAIVGWNQRRAGWFGGALFCILHIGDGVAQAGQRDFIVAVLLLVGMAALMQGVRLCSGGWIAVWGLLAGLSTAIKPQAAILLPAMLLLLWFGAGLKQGRGRLIFAGFSGWAGLLAVIGLWLARQHALKAFIDTVRGLMVYHAEMARHPLLFLLLHAITMQLLVLFVSSVILVPWKTLRRFDFMAITVGICFGVFSFCLQGKAYPYHRYPLTAFLTLFTAMALAGQSRKSETVRQDFYAHIAMYSMIACAGFWVGPASTVKALRYNWSYQPALTGLQADLERVVGGSHSFDMLQDQVQCMDTMAGCITVLNRMRLVQATGFLYDCYFFAPGSSATRDAMRAAFLRALEAQPPRVFVVTDQWCLNLPDGYNKLSQWSEFSIFLKQEYVLSEEQRKPHVDTRHLATWPFGYRLYTRKTRNY